MVIKSMKLKWYKIWFLWKGKIINHSSHFETKNSKTKRNANFSMHTYTSTSKLNTSTRYPNFCNWSTISWQWSKWFIHFYYKLLMIMNKLTFLFEKVYRRNFGLIFEFVQHQQSPTYYRWCKWFKIPLILL